MKQLKHLKVETISGVLLGHINDVVFETDGQMVAQYVVRSAMIGGDEYLISRTQVSAFTTEKMIVEDNITNVRAVHGPAEKNPLDLQPGTATLRKEM